MGKRIGIALLGAGTVGGGVNELLAGHGRHIAERAGVELAIDCVFARDEKRVAARLGGEVPFVGDWREAIERPGCEVVVELIGGTTTALDIAMASIELGKPLVTANKALIATHGEQLIAAARKAGTGVFFEAAVAGCIPAIRILRDSLAGDQVLGIHGIVNGTCNFILSRMTAAGIGFDAALAEAAELGYAEADPSLDIDGVDAAHKAVIMAWLAFGTPLAMDGIPVKGIRGADLADEQHAASFGFAVKHVATIKDHGEQGVEVGVSQALVASDHNLAKVDSNLNAILFDSAASGELLVVGAGAGALPTASAVVSDIIEAAHGKGWLGRLPASNGRAVIGSGQLAKQSYLRVRIEDVKGVVARLASILVDAGISIKALNQSESHAGSQVDVAMLLYESPWQKVVEAAERIARMPEVVAPPVYLPLALPHQD